MNSRDLAFRMFADDLSLHRDDHPIVRATSRAFSASRSA